MGLNTPNVTLNGTLDTSKANDGGYTVTVNGTLNYAEGTGGEIPKWAFDAKLKLSDGPNIRIVENQEGIYRGTAQFVAANATAYVPVQFEVFWVENNKKIKTEITISESSDSQSDAPVGVDVTFIINGEVNCALNQDQKIDYLTGSPKTSCGVSASGANTAAGVAKAGVDPLAAPRPPTSPKYTSSGVR